MAESSIVIPQLSYLELIAIQVGNTRVGTFWQRASGGEIQVATARSAPPNSRTTRAFSGKYSISGVTLEKEYTPDDNQINTVVSLLRNLRDPSNPENDIKIIREIPNTPIGGVKGMTKVTYINCVPTSIPILSDGDTTGDATIMSTRLSFEVGDVTLNIGGTEMDIMEWIGGGWNTSGSSTLSGKNALNLVNVRTGAVTNGSGSVAS